MLVVVECLERLAAVVAGVEHVVVVDLVLGLRELGTEEHTVDIYRLTKGDGVGCHAAYAARGLRAGPLVSRSHVLCAEVLHLDIVDGSVQGHVVGCLDEEILAHEVVGILHLYDHVDIPGRLHAVLGVGVLVGSHVEDDTLAAVDILGAYLTDGHVGGYEIGTLHDVGIDLAVGEIELGTTAELAAVHGRCAGEFHILGGVLCAKAHPLGLDSGVAERSLLDEGPVGLVVRDIELISLHTAVGLHTLVAAEVAEAAECGGLGQGHDQTVGQLIGACTGAFGMAGVLIPGVPQRMLVAVDSQRGIARGAALVYPRVGLGGPAGAVERSDLLSLAVAAGLCLAAETELGGVGKLQAIERRGDDKLHVAAGHGLGQVYPALLQLEGLKRTFRHLGEGVGVVAGIEFP